MKQEFLMPSNVYHYSKSYAGSEVQHQYYSDIEQAIFDAPDNATILLYDAVNLELLSESAKAKSKRLNLFNQYMATIGILKVSLTLDFDVQTRASALLILTTGDESLDTSISSSDPVALSGGNVAYTFRIAENSKMNKGQKGYLQLTAVIINRPYLCRNFDTGRLWAITLTSFSYKPAGMTNTFIRPTELLMTLKCQEFGVDVDFVGETAELTFNDLTTFAGFLSEFEPTELEIPVKLSYAYDTEDVIVVP